MASTTAPTSVFDYQAIRDAALRALGEVNARADKEAADANNNYNRLLGASADARAKDTVKSREASSANGLLDSSVALNNQADVGRAYDDTNAGYLRAFNGTNDNIGAERLNAQNAYTDANNQFEHYRTIGLDDGSTTGTPSPGVNDPTRNGDPATDPNAYATAAQAWMDATAKNNAANPPKALSVPVPAKIRAAAVNNPRIIKPTPIKTQIVTHTYNQGNNRLT